MIDGEDNEGGEDPRGEREGGASRPQTGASRPSTAAISEGGTSIPGLSNDELEELHDAFKMFDKDGDGTIDAAELGTALRSLGQNPNKEELKQMIAEMDNDNSGSIEFGEFATMMSKKTRTTESDLKQAFTFFDTEKNGVITEEEMRHALKTIGLELSENQFQEMLAAADTDGNGRITYEDFLNMWGTGSEEEDTA